MPLEWQFESGKKSNTAIALLALKEICMIEFLVVVLILALVAGLILVNKGKKNDAPVYTDGSGGGGNPFENTNVQEK